MTKYDELQRYLVANTHTWLITGVAGFIGSNLLETLLKVDQRVVGLDNFATGYQHNLDEVRSTVSDDQWSRFDFMNCDVRDAETCLEACKSIDYVLHQAALGSVPRSIEDPIQTNQANVDGFLNMLVAARDVGVKRFVYAASSSTYGDHPDLPKVEDRIGKPLSPYAVTKLVNELYADVFAATYGFKSIGLRYFNIFGQRQDPDGAYAAVIPQWIAGLIRGEPIYINGDGETSRDFCYVENAVQVNLLAACTEAPNALGHVYNVALNERTSLNGLFKLIQKILKKKIPHLKNRPTYRDFRLGDVRHSQADVSKAVRLLGYNPTCQIEYGLEASVNWYMKKLISNTGVAHIVTY